MSRWNLLPSIEINPPAKCKFIFHGCGFSRFPLFRPIESQFYPQLTTKYTPAWEKREIISRAHIAYKWHKNRFRFNSRNKSWAPKQISNQLWTFGNSGAYTGLGETISNAFFPQELCIAMTTNIHQIFMIFYFVAIKLWAEKIFSLCRILLGIPQN